MTFPITRVLSATGTEITATAAINTLIANINTLGDNIPIVTAISTSGNATAYFISIVVSYIPAQV
jgi:hypothetical protein